MVDVRSGSSSSTESPSQKLSRADRRESSGSQFDAYGFPSTNPATEEGPDFIRRQNERLVKWQAMLENWSLFTTKKREKLLSRTWKGIPDMLRWEVWRLCSAAPHAISSRKYQRLLSRASPQYERDIKDDIMRTFPDHERFIATAQAATLPLQAVEEALESDLEEEEEEGGVVVSDAEANSLSPRFTEGQVNLRDILSAYCVLDPECGYVHGMSYVAAVPLLYMPPENAFWVFSYLMLRHGYREYFLDGTPQMIRTTDTLSLLVQHFFPVLHHNMLAAGVNVQQFVAPWFLTIFTDRLPFALATRCWDWLFVVGHDALFVCALTVIKLKLSNEDITGDDLVESVMNLATSIPGISVEKFVNTSTSLSRSVMKQLEVIRKDRRDLVPMEAKHIALWEQAISGNTLSLQDTVS